MFYSNLIKFRSFDTTTYVKTSNIDVVLLLIDIMLVFFQILISFSINVYIYIFDGPSVMLIPILILHSTEILIRLENISLKLPVIVNIFEYIVILN